MAALNETKTQTTEEQLFMIEAMMPLFEKYLSPSDVVSFLTELDGALREEVVEKEVLGERQDAVTKLVTAVIDDISGNAASQFIYALRELGFDRGIEMVDDLEVDKTRQLVSKQYEVLLRMVEQHDLEKLIDTMQVIDAVRTYLSDADYERVKATFENRGNIAAFRKLFHYLPRLHPDWALQFMEAACGAGTNLKEKLDPAHLQEGDESLLTTMGDESMDSNIQVMEETDQVNQYDRSSSESDLLSDISNNDPDLEDLPVEDPEDQTIVKRVATAASAPASEETVPKTRQQRMEEVERMMSDPDFSDEEKQDDEEPEKQLNSEDESTDLKMRHYQMELAEKAVKGINTIICAPTGSGKTRVSLHIAKTHLDAAKKGEKKVVFLARTVPLVAQQYKAFTRFLQDYRILHLTGDSEYSMHLHHFLENYDIIVLTPQILENHLKLEKIKSLEVFTLMILDECHHTRKGEPYNCLMLRYLKDKLRKRTKKLPQVVGLTASLGVEKATTDLEAKLSILRLCANMDAPALSRVTKNTDELRQTVPVPEEKTVSLSEKRNDPGCQEIDKVMNKIEDLLIDIYDLHDPDIDKLLMSKRPKDKNCQAYGQWAVKLRNAAKVAQTRGQDEDDAEAKSENARNIYVMADQLSTYNAALEIHDICRIEDVLNFLTNKFSHTCHRKNRHNDCEKQIDEMFQGLKKKLMRLQKSDKVGNPNLEILAKTLTDLLVQKNNEARGIIFVRTRATCYALTDWLNGDDVASVLKDLNATSFTGAGVHEDEGGMTQNDQETIISKFRTGDIKLIVATSVAEEGLDIPECNIVIKYNHVGNEITTLQTRGRSRKQGGTSVLLGSQKIQEKEMLNVARAAMMYRAIHAVCNMTEDQVKNKMREFQDEALHKEDIKEEVRRYYTSNRLQGDFTLICCVCRQFCSSSQNIKTILGTHHVFIGKNEDKILDRVNVIPFKNQKKPFDGIRITGKMQCKKCHSLWGVLFIYNGVSFPSLGIKYFTVVHEDGSQNAYKKWHEVPYDIKEIDLDDFRSHLSGIRNGGESEVRQQ